MYHVIYSLYSSMQLRLVLKKIMSRSCHVPSSFLLRCGCVDFIAYAKKSHLVISGDLHSLGTGQILHWPWLMADFWLLRDALATAFFKSCSRPFSVSPNLWLSCSKFITLRVVVNSGCLIHFRSPYTARECEWSLFSVTLSLILTRKKWRCSCSCR